MLWLLIKLTDVIRDIVYGLLAVVVEWFTDLLSLTSTQFYDAFQQGADVNMLAKIQNNIIFPLSISFLIGIMVWQLYRSMFSRNAKNAEEPVMLVCRTGVFVFLALNWNLIVYGVSGAGGDYEKNTPCLMDLYAGIWNWLDKSFLSPSAVFDQASFAGAETVTNSITDSIKDITAVLIPGAGLIAGIISLILAFVLGWRFVKLIFIYISRFVEMKLLEIFMPLGLSAGGSAQTKDITKKYITSYLSSVLSVFLSALVTYLYCFLMAATLTWNGSGIGQNMVLLAMTLGLYSVFTKLDTYLDKIGLTNTPNHAAPGFPGLAMANGMRMIKTGGDLVKSIQNGMRQISGHVDGISGKDGTSMGAGPGGILGKNGMGVRRGSQTDGKTGKEAARTAAAAAAAILSGGTTAAGADVLGAVESAIGKGMSQPQTMDGAAVNDDNSAIAILSGDKNNPDVSRIAMEGKSGQWKDLATGELIPGESLMTMQEQIAGKGIESGHVSVNSQNPDGTMTMIRLERDPQTGQWIHAGTGEALSAHERNALNAALSSPSEGMGSCTSVADVAAGGLNPAGKGFEDALKGASPDADGIIHGAFHTKDGSFGVQFKETGHGLETTVDGKTYPSPETAAREVKATSADVYNGAPEVSDGSMNLGSGVQARVAAVKASGIDPQNSAGFAASLESCALKNQQGESVVNGMMKGADGSRMAVQYTKTGDGTWSATVNGTTYSSPGLAAQAYGAEKVDLYGPEKNLDAGYIRQSGGIDHAFRKTAGIREGRSCSAMPENQGYKVVSVGNNQIHGVYADPDGRVKGFSGNVVGAGYAEKHPDHCISIDAGKGKQLYMRINEGISDSSVRQYVENTEFVNGQFVNKYDRHRSLDEEGGA